MYMYTGCPEYKINDYHSGGLTLQTRYQPGSNVSHKAYPSKTDATNTNFVQIPILLGKVLIKQFKESSTKLNFYQILQPKLDEVTLRQCN